MKKVDSSVYFSVFFLSHNNVLSTVVQSGFVPTEYFCVNGEPGCKGLTRTGPTL